MKSIFNFIISSDRMALKLCIVLCLASGVYIAALQPDILGFYHDDGVYAVTAKALAEGKGYRIISLPKEPSQMTYPIFYPLVLSVVWRIFPEFPANIPALKAPSIIFTLLFLWITYQYLVRRNYASKRMALAIVLMTAVNPWTVWAATMAMSEALYCLLSVLALWTTELFISSTRGPKHKRYIYLVLAGMTIAASITTRSIGISVLSATFIYLFLNKRRGTKDRRQLAVGSKVSNSDTLPDAQKLAFCNSQQNTGKQSLSMPPNPQPAPQNQKSEIRNPKSPDRRSWSFSTIKKGFALGTQLELAVCFFLAPWLVWTVMQYIHQTHMEIYPYRSTFQSYISGVNSFWHEFGAAFFLKTFLLNLYQCFLGAIPNMALPGVDVGSVSSINFIKDYMWFGATAALGAFLSIAVLIIQIKGLLSGKFSLVNMYAIFVLLIVLFWPVNPDRFLIPVMPFILLFFLNGFTDLIKRLDYFRKTSILRGARALPVWVPLSIVILNSGLALAKDGVTIVESKRSEGWTEKKRLFRWIRENTHDEAILASMVSPAFYLYTGRRAIPPSVNIDLNDVSQLPGEMVTENFRNLLDYTEGRDLYLVKTAYPYPPIYEQMIDRLAIKYPERVSLMYVGKNLRYAVYRMR